MVVREREKRVLRCSSADTMTKLAMSVRPHKSWKELGLEDWP
jgi:hypothetical protein